jgi:hypothetical protein
MLEQQPILHLALINLRPNSASSTGKPDEVAIQTLLSAFARLAEIDGVLHLGSTRAASDDSTHTLGLFALLRDAQALEEFGTHPRHIEYLQSAVLPLVSELATADVVVPKAPPGRARLWRVWPPPSYRAAACFCAGFQSTTYDWQVRSLFDAAAQVPGHVIIGGLAVNGRQRYRAAGLTLWPEPDDWSPSRRGDSFRRLWNDCWGPAATDLARVVGPATPIGPAAPEAAS